CSTARDKCGLSFESSCHPACQRLKVQPAGDFNALARDPAVALTENGGDCPANVFGPAVASECGDGGDELLKLLVVAQNSVAEISRGRSRRDAIYGDVSRSDFLREIAAEDLHCAFDGPVDDALGRIDASGATRDVDD